MNYEQNDTYGMYKVKPLSSGPDDRAGPGPHLMGADTLVGNNVYGTQHHSNSARL